MVIKFKLKYRIHFFAKNRMEMSNDMKDGKTKRASGTEVAKRLQNSRDLKLSS